MAVPSIGDTFLPMPFLTALAALLASAAVASAAPPAGFTTETIASGWNEAQGTTFLPDGRAVVWERGGKVWLVGLDGVKSTTPLVDISEETGAWRDYGLMSVAVHPAFETNGWFFLLYVVDRHHLDAFGTASYSPTTNVYFAASIGRITRFTANAATGFTTVVPGSRKVLVGETAATGVPIVHQSHGLGSLAFAEDGTLLATTGDAASYLEVDVGGQVADGYVNDALARGILRAKENIGAFRSQLVDCLNGKLLRIDPDSGDGVPSNPWFDASAPRSARSRVFALGLRNPFRMTIVPESGGHLPSEGDPGTVVIGDVGWDQWEDLQICDAPRQNFGWPVFEGLTHRAGYSTSNLTNPDVAASGGACGSNHRFRDLIVQDSQDATALLHLDPCGFQQAESATAVGAPVATQYAGFQGSGYRDYAQSSGERITFAYSVPTTGSYTLWVRYANGGGSDRPLRVEVDGSTAVASMSYPPTGAWTEWRLRSARLTLAAGARQIALVGIGSSGGNIDAVALVPAGSPAPQIAASAPRFVHRRPVLEWAHATATARVPTYSSGAAIATSIGGTSGVAGTNFSGLCAVGGPLVDTPSWPAEHRDAFYFGDFASNWIRSFKLGANGAITSVGVFDTAAPGIVSLAHNPVDGSLWTVRWGSAVVRHRYQPGANQPPAARIAAAPHYGASPLVVTLSAATSSDPEGGALTYSWNFGDGTPTATGATVTHTYVASGSGPQRFDPVVTVADPGGATATATTVVSVNNTPPTVAITSLYDGMPYPLDAETIYPLRAQKSDAEQAAGTLACAWRTILHHNTHDHSEPVDPACETTTVISPLGCGAETYFFEVELVVTDSAGLTATDRVHLYPDCAGWLACPEDIDRDGVVGPADLAALLSRWGLPGAPDFDRSGAVDGGDLTALLNAWGACPNG
jgi:glucose/arabinose dehydrogenase